MIEVEELAFSHGEIAAHVYFPDSGHINYCVPNQVLSELQRSGQAATQIGYRRTLREAAMKTTRLVHGHCVSEPGLWTQWVYGGNLRAVSQSSLLVLSVAEFTTVATTYPRVKKLCVVYAHRFVHYCRRCSEALSDLFDYTKLPNESNIFS